MLFNWMSRMSRVAAALVLMNTGAHVATAQTAPPTSQTSSEDRLRAAIEEARAKPYLDKDGGYKDKTGGYYNPKAGTYTDEKGRHRRQLGWLHLQRRFL